MNKFELIEKIKEDIELNWTEPTTGRVTLNPSSHSQHIPGHYDSENMHLFTGEYAKLLHLLGELDIDTQNRLVKGVQSCEVNGVPGLYNRWVDDSSRSLSHDEINGIILVASTMEFDYISRRLITYGVNHNWAYINENPGADGLQLLGIKEPLENGVAPRWFFPYFSRMKQPRDVAFYKLVAGEKINFFELLNFVVAALISSGDPRESTTGKIQWWFKFKSIDLSKSKVLTWTCNRFIKKLKADYGETPLKEMFSIYFRKDHPFHDLVRLLDE